MKIVVAGNCQAMPLKRVLLDVLDDAEVSAYTIHSANDKIGKKFTNEIKKADLVLSFKISDRFRLKDFRPDVVRTNAEDRFKSITNLFFSGYHPDYSYVNDELGQRVIGVLGDYHSRICIIGCLLGIPSNSIVAAMVSKDVGSELGYSLAFSRSLRELTTRDEGIDIGYAERLMNIAKREELFLTFNHPKNYVFYDYVYHILDTLSIPYRKVLPYSFAESLGDGPALSVHPLVSDLLGGRVDSFREVSVKAAKQSKFLELGEFVDLSSQHYDKISDKSREFILSLPWAQRITKILK